MSRVNISPHLDLLGAPTTPALAGAEAPATEASTGAISTELAAAATLGTIADSIAALTAATTTPGTEVPDTEASTGGFFITEPAVAAAPGTIADSSVPLAAAATTPRTLLQWINIHC